MAATIRLSQQHSCSFDHLVGTQQERLGNHEVECLGGGQVNDEIVLSGLLHGQIAGLRAEQDFVDVVGRAPKRSREIWSIGHQASNFDISASGVVRWQARRERQSVNPRSMSERQRLAHYEQRISLLRDRRDGGGNILGTQNRRRRYLDTKGTGSGPNDVDLYHGGRVVAVEQDRQSTQTRNDLAQQLEPLAREIDILG
jgi:hypothetical protein